MQVTLDIDPSQLSIGVLEILRGLTQEKKNEIAADVVRDWLSTTSVEEKKIYENELIRTMMKSKGKTEEQIRDDYNFRENMRKFTPVRERMIKLIIEEGVVAFKNIISLEIGANEYLQKVFKECLESVKYNMPSYVQQAIIKWFCDNMSTIMMNMQTFEIDKISTNGNVDKIMEHLRSQGAMI
jgi:hypothetical protein